MRHATLSQPFVRRKLYANALNNASASFLISPMYLTRQYP